MPSTKQASKRKAGKKTVPVLSAAGLSLFAGGASATTGPAADVTVTPNITPNQQVILGEEEVSDVSLATFYVFDKETTNLPAGTTQLARAGGCGGCGHGCGGGCRGRGCGGCRGCGFGCGGCGCTCCLSWGACRWC